MSGKWWELWQNLLRLAPICPRIPLVDRDLRWGSGPLPRDSNRQPHHLPDMSRSRFVDLEADRERPGG